MSLGDLMMHYETGALLALVDDRDHAVCAEYLAAQTAWSALQIANITALPIARRVLLALAASRGAAGVRLVGEWTLKVRHNGWAAFPDGAKARSGLIDLALDIELIPPPLTWPAAERMFSSVLGHPQVVKIATGLAAVDRRRVELIAWCDSLADVELVEFNNDMVRYHARRTAEADDPRVAGRAAAQCFAEWQHDMAAACPFRDPARRQGFIATEASAQVSRLHRTFVLACRRVGPVQVEKSIAAIANPGDAP